VSDASVPEKSGTEHARTLASQLGHYLSRIKRPMVLSLLLLQLQTLACRRDNANLPLPGQLILQDRTDLFGRHSQLQAARL
jgi:hypothetical protein